MSRVNLNILRGPRFKPQVGERYAFDVSEFFLDNPGKPVCQYQVKFKVTFARLTGPSTYEFEGKLITVAGESRIGRVNGSYDIVNDCGYILLPKGP